MRTSIAALLLPLALSASTAAAGVCASFPAVAEQLARKYGETRQSMGYVGPTQVVLVWANLESGTWTITATAPDGNTCVLAAGQNFTQINEPAGEAM